MAPKPQLLANDLRPGPQGDYQKNTSLSRACSLDECRGPRPTCGKGIIRSKISGLSGTFYPERSGWSRSKSSSDYSPIWQNEGWRRAHIQLIFLSANYWDAWQKPAISPLWAGVLPASRNPSPPCPRRQSPLCRRARHVEEAAGAAGFRRGLKPESGTPGSGIEHRRNRAGRRWTAPPRPAPPDRF
jgi:hypothetical protein